MKLTSGFALALVLLCTALSANAGRGGAKSYERAVYSAVLQELLSKSPYPAAWLTLKTIKGIPRGRSVKWKKLVVELEPGSRLMGPVPVKVTELQKRGTARTYWVTAVVQVRAPVVVAGRDLSRGVVLTSDDVRIEERDLSGLGSSYIHAGRIQDVLGMKLKIPCAAGRPIYSEILKPPAIVHKGDPVEILARSRGIVISVPGVARADAGIGEAVPVLNVKSRRSLLGTVLDKNRVEVRF